MPFALLPILAAAAMPIPMPAMAMRAPACSRYQLTLRTDDRDGDFNGMSHSGTYLILRNMGPRACSLPGLPLVSFRDAHGRTLPITRTAPPGMHPGPVVLPAVIPPRGEVQTGVRWVSGQVYDHGRCWSVASVRVAVGTGGVARRLTATICGPGRTAGFEQPVLALSPRS